MVKYPAARKKPPYVLTNIAIGSEVTSKGI
jgi:hypothetical protein